MQVEKAGEDNQTKTTQNGKKQLMGKQVHSMTNQTK